MAACIMKSTSYRAVESRAASKQHRIVHQQYSRTHVVSQQQHQQADESKQRIERRKEEVLLVAASLAVCVDMCSYFRTSGLVVLDNCCVVECPAADDVTSYCCTGKVVDPYMTQKYQKVLRSSQ